MRPSIRLSDETLDRLSEIGNYYEHAVLERLCRYAHSLDAEQFADAACLALNALPPWYIRHSVDACFFLKQDEVLAMDRRIDAAIAQAVERVSRKPP